MELHAGKEEGVIGVVRWWRGVATSLQGRELVQI